MKKERERKIGLCPKLGKAIADDEFIQKSWTVMGDGLVLRLTI